MLQLCHAKAEVKEFQYDMRKSNKIIVFKVGGKQYNAPNQGEINLDVAFYMHRIEFVIQFDGDFRRRI